MKSDDNQGNKSNNFNVNDDIMNKDNLKEDIKIDENIKKLLMFYSVNTKIQKKAEVLQTVITEKRT